MAGRQVTIQFIGDAKSLISATSSAGKSTTSLGDKLKRVGKAAILGFGTAAVVAGKAMYDMAEAAVEDQKSAALLANTLKNTTHATKDQIASVEDWISKQGQLYGVTDDDLRPALAKLAAATGDITKAQKSASLAMDVAAGNGKSLSAVTQTLAKAISTGSVTALGKYQVATKNADGTTKSLAEVTDELSKKYGGSAAKAADTAAGKFQRLKVDLSETAEAIGYKLLPYADDLGDWLLKTGVPAVEGFAHSFKQELGPVLRDAKTWVGDNKDELKDLGRRGRRHGHPSDPRPRRLRRGCGQVLLGLAESGEVGDGRAGDRCCGGPEAIGRAEWPVVLGGPEHRPTGRLAQGAADDGGHCWHRSDRGRRAQGQQGGLPDGRRADRRLRGRHCWVGHPGHRHCHRRSGRRRRRRRHRLGQDAQRCRPRQASRRRTPARRSAIWPTLSTK
jgi:competence protein ComGC